MRAPNLGSVATAVRHPYGAYIRQGSTVLALFAVKPAVDGSTTSRRWGMTQYTTIYIYIDIYIYINMNKT